jgi:hypothetical protein
LQASQRCRDLSLPMAASTGTLLIFGNIINIVVITISFFVIINFSKIVVNFVEVVKNSRNKLAAPAKYELLTRVSSGQYRET